MADKRLARKARRGARCASTRGRHPLCSHHCLLFAHDPYPWLCNALPLPSLPLPLHSHSNSSLTRFNTSHLPQLFAELASVVRWHGSDSDAVERRLQSIAAWAPQTDYYTALATRVQISTICEVGFNAGHSAVVLLSANPTARLEAFDTFSLSHSAASLRLVSRLFPGRVSPHKGLSSDTVPAARLHRPCDLVIIDGRHHFEAVLQDFVNFRKHAHPGTLFVFDDICDSTRSAKCPARLGVQFGGRDAPCRKLGMQVRYHMAQGPDERNGT
ncbi:MAG: hypothetical protein SGPRY_002120 [Prymnesium sp.]